MTTELEQKLRHLRLSGIATVLPVRNQEAISNHLAYVEFLELLVEDELARRRDLLFARRLKQPRIAQVKSLDNFDWAFNPEIPKQLILDLATTRFVDEHGGVLLLGPPGTGKAHVALASRATPYILATPFTTAPPSTWCRTSPKPTRQGHAGN